MLMGRRIAIIIFYYYYMDNFVRVHKELILDGIG